MTDRLKGCWVSFTHDIRDDDAEPLINAIKALRGVEGVECQVSDPGDWMARMHVRHEIGDKILDLVMKLTKSS